MDKMKRIFIALKVDAGETLKKMISELKSGLKRDIIKWTSTDNIHITLAFLGDTDEKMIMPVISILNELCIGSAKFNLILKGLGVFRNMNDPGIIWTGIEPSEELVRLNKVIMTGLKGINIKVEERPYNPHLTIGRIKHITDKEVLRSLIRQFHDSEIQIVPVNDIILFESILHPSGPEYNPLAKISLE
jgi:2'-5' RNA ligase